MSDRYLVVVEEGPRSYAAYIPDLPGVIGTGETREEALGELRVALRMHLAGLREDGVEIPPPTTSVDYVTP